MNDAPQPPRRLNREHVATGAAWVCRVEPALQQVPLPLELVEEVTGKVAVAEEQPVASRRPALSSIFDECPEGSNAGSRPDQDDVGTIVGGQSKA